MASAAAVATTVDQSPPPYQKTDEITNTTATVIGANDKLPDEVDGDDDDEDVMRPIRRQPVGPGSNGTYNDKEDDAVLAEEDEDEGLFGSEPDDVDSRKPRQLEDEELDSGDDEGRLDRVMRDDEVVEESSQSFMDISLPRHPVPEPSDGELYLFKVPRFLSIEPTAFDPENFQPPTKEHHSNEVPSNTFSARNTALTTIRWRPSPASPTLLQSNSRIIRWSDGSLTLQMANEPQTQYTINGRPLAPPQLNPRKPTPTSAKMQKQKKPTPYNVEDESFTYLTAPNTSSQFLRVTHKFTTSLSVEPASNANDMQMDRLRAQYAALQNGGMGDAEITGMGVVHITEDPELSKKKAELAEKEKQRAQKRREAQEQRDRERGGGPRSGFGRRGERGGGGLTVGGLEDDDELGRGSSGRTTGTGKARAKPKRQNRRGEILSDEEEEYGRRIRTREDEYDEEDDFVAPSDEEEDVEESAGDEDEGIVLESKPSGRRQQDADTSRNTGVSSSKRNVDADAEGDVDEEALGMTAPAETEGAGSPTGRTTKRRRVIEEDEDEE